MKKKELKKRIKHLQELTDCLISDNVRLMMPLGDLPCYEEVKERFNYNNVEIPKFGTCTQEDEKVTQLTAEEKTMLYNGELQICYSDLKNASSIIADVFPEDTTISFFESATNFLTGWKLGMWKTDNRAFENVKVVEV